ncbi:ATP-dependent carboxylate-amine ligase [Herbidospora galbida]|uniref:ATP-dependent carboxylate-amine ligase n=1 Tax=Herbidospora galbida TaxID=2575442 RepID=A0A4U3MHK7_9ACTN|nr:ATP-dependent carboxylate-amine ligase [Herbidospora galbida]TKK87982.1 ATP-dependent carboxylate-amine ligase [Herbidospora galbida]
MPSEILILTAEGDAHAEKVAAILAARGVEAVMFDPADYPSRARINAAYGPGTQVRRTLHTDGHPLDLDALTAVWFRRPQPPAAHPEITDPAVRVYVEGECSAFTADLWDQLDCRHVPARRQTIMLAQRKSSQLALAGRLGFDLPATLVTTDPDEFLDFYDRHSGQIITKPLHDPRPPANAGAELGRFSEPVSTHDVIHADAIRLAPVIVQEYVVKQVELRVTVVGRAVFAAEIHSQESNHTRFDWRRYDLGSTRHEPHRLPTDVARRCVEIVERLGLRYGAIDLILTPDGRYVFLEVNPSGQWLWIESATGLPISEALCDLLLYGEVHGGKGDR